MGTFYETPSTKSRRVKFFKYCNFVAESEVKHPQFHIYALHLYVYARKFFLKLMKFEQTKYWKKCEKVSPQIWIRRLVQKAKSEATCNHKSFSTTSYCCHGFNGKNLSFYKIFSISMFSRVLFFCFLKRGKLHAASKKINQNTREMAISKIVDFEWSLILK